MPVKDGVEFLESAVHSVFASQKAAEDTALVLVDGGSTDGSRELASELKGRVSRRISVIDRTPAGVFDAVNQVWSTSESKILGWLNADDLYFPGAVDRALALLERPDIQWCHGRCEIVDERNQPIRRFVSLYKHLLSRTGTFRRLLVENFISQPTVFVRRALWKQAGPLSDRYQFASDYDLWIRLYAISKPWYISRRQAGYRVHSRTLSSQNYTAQFREQLSIARQHAGCRYPCALAIHRLFRMRTNLVYSILNGRYRNGASQSGGGQ